MSSSCWTRLKRRGNMDRADGVNGSTGSAALSKTSSSEWNSSDDLAGPVSEQEDSLSCADAHPLAHHQLTKRPSHLSGPPLPPKPQALRSENRRALIPDSAHIRPKSPAYKAATLSKMSLWLENSEPNMHSSSDSSSKSGLSDQERPDLSASESEDKCSSIADGYESTVTGEYALPSTYFSVDSCMTDTYRAKYHKKGSALQTAADYKTGEHTSSSESDHGERASPAPADLKIPDLSRTMKEPGISTIESKVFYIKKYFVIDKTAWGKMLNMTVAHPSFQHIPAVNPW